MSEPKTRLSELITELSQLEHSEPERPLGEHGARSKEIRQELVELYRDEG